MDKKTEQEMRFDYLDARVKQLENRFNEHTKYWNDRIDWWVHYFNEQMIAWEERLRDELTGDKARESFVKELTI